VVSHAHEWIHSGMWTKLLDYVKQLLLLIVVMGSQYISHHYNHLLNLKWWYQVSKKQFK